MSTIVGESIELAYAVRMQVLPGTEDDPASLMAQVVDLGIETRTRGVHHSDFRLSETTTVVDEEGKMWLVSGANFNPVGGKDPTRICGFGAMMLRAVKQTDKIASFLYIAGPSRQEQVLKPIVGCKPMNTVPSCAPCLDTLIEIDPYMRVFAGNDGSREIIDGYFAIDAYRYHGQNGKYPVPPSGLTTLGFFLESVSMVHTGLILREAGLFIPTTIHPDDRT